LLVKIAQFFRIEFHIHQVRDVICCYKCEFRAKTVFLETASAHIIFMCCKKQPRSPWRWSRRTSNRVEIKKWL